MTSESTSSLKVLVAEDEPAMLSLVGRHMKSLGFNVVEASDGDMAWDLAAKHHPDLVILDVMMPGMSGWEICKRLKSDASEGRPFANTGVIMLTGIGENLNEMTSPLFAADAWLNKPFDFGELDGKVRETLTQYGKPLPSPLSDRDRADHGAARGAASSSAASPTRGQASEGSANPEQEGGGMASKMANAVVKKAAAVVQKVAGAVKKAVEPAKKAATKKAATKKTAAKKSTAKKTAKRTGGAKAAAKPASAAKKTAKRATAKKAAAGAKKAAPKKAASKKSASKKSASRKSAS